MLDWIPANMELDTDVAVADWITSALDPWDPSGAHVGSLLPGGSEMYARVFHPVEDRDSSDVTGRSWAEIGSERAVSIAPDISFAEIVGYEGDDPSELLRVAPEPGRIPAEVCRTLATTLTRQTTMPGDCWFGLWAGWGELSSWAMPYLLAPTSFRGRWAFLREMKRRNRANRAASEAFDTIPTASAGLGRHYLLFHGPLGSACSFEPVVGSAAVTPSLWWPKDRAWVVATDIDGLSTYVAGSREAIGDVITAPGLEALEVTRDVLID